MADSTDAELVADGKDFETVEYKPSADTESGMVKVTQSNGRTPLTPTQPRRNSRIPILFERAAKDWWNPKFDSKVLEDMHRKISLPQTKKRFQYALCYIILSCVAWCIFFAVVQQTPYWIVFLAGSVVLVIITAVILGFSYTKLYEKYVVTTSVFISVLICFFCLLYFIHPDEDMSALGVFTGSIEILLMMYTVIPLPLYLCAGLGIIYSVAFELLSGFLTDMNDVTFIVARVLTHICIHVIGIHIFIMAQVRKRSTFLKVGQSIMSHNELHVEKSLQQQMIHSLMPPLVAQEVIKSSGMQMGKSGNNDHNFRHLHMDKMDNVSILFADIVGFTKMSSNKTAEHLVSLLNDLFGRFDKLCTNSGCEKISTLGDCYYAVSGCPTPRDDHASCCVQMGLAMCKAIKEFDRDHNEEVDMRIGVHTGSVLCGLVGTRRFKFDVWSHDVTLANTMESTGLAGRVHISAQTAALVSDEFDLELGEEVQDIRSTKRLTECFDPNTQQYIVKHVGDNNVILTYYVIGKKNVAQLKEEADAEENPKESEEPPEVGENIKITIDSEPALEQNTEEVEKDDSTEKSVNHLETSHNTSQADPELSTASLLGKRENITSSVEDLDTENKEGPLWREQIRIHEQSDNLLIKGMNADYKRAIQYLYKPPINQCTLQFTVPYLEKKYHKHYIEDVDVIRTMALPKFSALFDMIVSVIFFTLISICCFLRFEIHTVWIIVFCIGLLFEFLMLLPLICITCSLNTLGRLGTLFTSWHIRHLCGAVIASLPAVAVYANFGCDMTDMNMLFYGMLLIVSLLHYCNFNMLSSLMKSVLAVITGLVLVVLWAIDVCTMNILGLNGNKTGFGYENTTEVPSTNQTMAGPLINMEHEIILNIVLFLFLVCFLNREFEISYRLCFHGDQQALKDRAEMQNEKEQADWLLHNIIPEHVADVIKKTSRYCENHKDVGVVFASITNFDEFYDESFRGGQEYLRVLNELMGDFEELFNQPRYKDVEKIKTIGSCLMTASGLNPHTRKLNKDSNSHLYALMDFCLDILSKLEQFNLEMLNFDFKMKIGFNYGPVTSGVIGTTKLLYDIWGDTVNISSRMYSTGVTGRIQVTEDTANKLGDKFNFEYRGETTVKGKGVMKTYLLVSKKPDALWD